MYFSLPCKYVSSVSWMTEGTCLAVGTSEGEIQVLGSVSVSQRVLYSGGITKVDFFKAFFFIWTILKIFIEFGTALLLFYVLFLWLQGM